MPAAYNTAAGLSQDARTNALRTLETRKERRLRLMNGLSVRVTLLLTERRILSSLFLPLLPLFSPRINKRFSQVARIRRYTLMGTAIKKAIHLGMGTTGLALRLSVLLGFPLWHW